MSNSQLPHLETFSQAAELGSFTAAAHALGLTQAAVSQRIQAVEKELGLALFERHGGRVNLTRAGRQLYDYAQQILDLHRAARQAVTGKTCPLTGEWLLAASSIPGEYLLPGLLAVFRSQHGGIYVRASETDSLEALDRVERGRVHLGLVGRKSDSPHLQFQPFAADDMLLVVPPGHRWSRGREVFWKQFCREPLVVREPGSGSRWCLEQALSDRRKSLADLEVALELGSNAAIKQAVRQGLGVAVLSLLAVRKDVDAGELHALHVRDLTLDRTLFVVWDKRRALPAAARAFLHFLERVPGTK